MAAGIPGLGLGGLFFVLSALVAPAIELARTLRGQSSRAAWRQVGRQLAIALTMVCVLDLSLRAAFLLAGVMGLDAPGVDRITVLPLTQVGIAIGVLAALLAGAKATQLLVGPLEPQRAPAHKLVVTHHVRRRGPAHAGQPAALVTRGHQQGA